MPDRPPATPALGGAPEATAPGQPQEILDAARRLLLAGGYGSISMRKIADEVGLTVSTLYFHVRDKDAIVHALMDEGFQCWYEALLALRDDRALTAPERVEAFARAYVRFGLENPAYYEIMYLLPPERLSRYPRTSYRRARRSLDLLAAFLAEASAEPVGAGREGELPATAAWGMLHGTVAILLAGRLDASISRERYLDTLIGHLLTAFHIPRPAPESAARIAAAVQAALRAPGAQGAPGAPGAPPRARPSPGGD